MMCECGYLPCLCKLSEWLGRAGHYTLVPAGKGDLFSLDFSIMNLYACFQVPQVATGSILETSTWVPLATKIPK